MELGWHRSTSVATRSGQVKVFDADGQLRAAIDGNIPIAWRPGRSEFAVNDRQSRSVFLWSEAGERLPTVTAYDDSCHAIAWSPKGRNRITVRTVVGEPFDRIIACELGELPEPSPAWSEIDTVPDGDPATVVGGDRELVLGRLCSCVPEVGRERFEVRWWWSRGCAEDVLQNPYAADDGEVSTTCARSSPTVTAIVSPSRNHIATSGQRASAAGRLGELIG